jgi:hypothetical protein
MYGNVRTVKVHEAFDVTRLAWDTESIEVPRCPDCSVAHKAVAWVQGWTVVMCTMGMLVFLGTAVWWGRYAPTAGGAALYFFAGAAFGVRAQRQCGTSPARWPSEARDPIHLRRGA